jgi:hypothetical protein
MITGSMAIGGLIGHSVKLIIHLYVVYEVLSPLLIPLLDVVLN